MNEITYVPAFVVQTLLPKLVNKRPMVGQQREIGRTSQKGERNSGKKELWEEKKDTGEETYVTKSLEGLDRIR